MRNIILIVGICLASSVALEIPLMAQAQGECGDNRCGTGESEHNCVQDCDTHCGNGQCDLAVESCSSCPEDCGVCDNTCSPAECEGPDCLAKCISQESFPRIANDVVTGEETIIESSCPAVLFNECGNGICEQDELGTNCKDRCEIDCGGCEVMCGDVFCDAVNGENCSSCTQDCGPCLCRRESGVPIGVQTSIELLKWNLSSPELMQTSAQLVLKASIKPTLVSEVDGCTGKAPVKGEMSLCQKYFGKRFCVGATLAGPASCSARCEPGLSACSPLTSCCKAATVTGSLFGSLGYELKGDIGIYSCSVSVDAGLSSGLAIGQLQAGLADTCQTKWSLQPKNGIAPSFQMFANGGARCGTTLFGIHNDVAGVGIANCASVTLDSFTETGFSVPKIASSGAAMSIAWPSIKVGYLFINSWKNKFELGAGCAF